MIYFRLADDNLWNQVNIAFGNRGGVYKLVSLADGKVIPVARFLGADIEGILYIGKATSYIDRVINLKKSISPFYKGSSHICGRRYKSISKIAQQFPFEGLHLELIECEEPAKLESTLIRTYHQNFGEVPPLNAV